MKRRGKNVKITFNQNLKAKNKFYVNEKTSLQGKVCIPNKLPTRLYFQAPLTEPNTLPRHITGLNQLKGAQMLKDRAPTSIPMKIDKYIPGTLENEDFLNFYYDLDNGYLRPSDFIKVDADYILPSSQQMVFRQPSSL